MRNKSKVIFSLCSKCSHHGPAVSRFLVTNGSTNGAGCLRGLLRLIKTHFEKFLGQLSEIGTLGTLIGSHGTKKIFSKIFSWKDNRVWVVRFGGYLGKTLIWGFKRSFLSPCSLKAFYDLFSPQILLFAQIPPKRKYSDPNNFPWENFWEIFLGPMGPR